MLTPEQIKAAQEAFNTAFDNGAAPNDCWNAALTTLAAEYEKKLDAAREVRDAVELLAKTLHVFERGLATEKALDSVISNLSTAVDAFDAAKEG